MDTEPAEAVDTFLFPINYGHTLTLQGTMNQPYSVIAH